MEKMKLDVACGEGLVTRAVREHEVPQALGLTKPEGWVLNIQALSHILTCQPSAIMGTFTQDGTLICKWTSTCSRI